MVTRTLLAAVLALLLIGGAPAAAQTPDPGELWEEFPLEPSPTPTQPVATPTERVRIVQTEGGADWFGIVSLMVLGAGLGAMGASLARGRRRSRARAAAAPESAVAAPAAPKPATSSPPAKAAEPQRQRSPAAPARNAPAPPRPGTARPKPLAPQPETPGPRQRTKAPPPRAPAPQRTAQRPAPLFERAQAKSEWETCRIQLWHGYVKKQFYAEAPDRDAWIAWSPYFRVEKGSTIEDSEQAEAALAELVDTLVADGWEVAGRRAGTLEVALRRRTGAARPAPR